MTGDVPTVSVVVPTYRRPQLLQRCIDALRRQSQPANELIVVRRRDDADATAAVESAPDVQVVVVDEPGTVAAMTAGVRAATGDVIAFTDDDAAPRRDWIERVRRRLADPSVGAVGGRDISSVPARDGGRALTHDVGRITGWGKLIGNHHLGTGSPRAVMVLKGVNMAFRRDCLALPRGLRGTGAQPHWEVATSLFALRRGWRLIYDPDITVNHYPGPRFGDERRDRIDAAAMTDMAYNLVASVVAVDGARLWRRALYGLLVGDRGCPGVARAALAVIRRERGVVGALIPSLYGQAVALFDAIRGPRLAFVTFDREAPSAGQPTGAVPSSQMTPATAHADGRSR